MENLINSGWFKIVFWIIALLASALLSIFAYDIHGDNKPTKNAGLIQQ